ncbi:MAG: stage IV sporulation protein A [Oscillospiraceae bacterium]|nr:stage IV sporulation protein A [Oscillospiraceae bacterium]
MEKRNIYADISRRTEGNIYVGVVGPVRSGKSTFIKKFMETLVIPRIENEFVRDRAVDELPQSSGGKTIMTTEPKFIPEEAVNVQLAENAGMNVRLIDCVGYIVPSALGYIENENPRMVSTPWFEEAIPFNMAAEVGTRKVITDHSSIGLVITTDGSITDIPRAEYEEAEERVINELKDIRKPFAVLLNTTSPNSAATAELRMALEEKYGVPVVATSCLDLREEDIREVLRSVLFQFPVKEVCVDIPGWISALEKNHWLKASVYGQIQSAAKAIQRVRDVEGAFSALAECEHIDAHKVEDIDLGRGSVRMNISVHTSLFYTILGEATGIEIDGESGLMPTMIELARIKKAYDKIRSALDEVTATGYGIVMPGLEELTLEEPQIVSQGGKYGVKLRASAPSIHMMRADITTEISPIVGSEKQSEELVMFLLNDFTENPEKIWNSNIFGTSLHQLVNEGLRNKLYRMPSDARIKLQETIERIINEGCSGLVCIIL